MTFALGIACLITLCLIALISWVCFCGSLADKLEKKFGYFLGSTVWLSLLFGPPLFVVVFLLALFGVCNGGK